MTIRELGTGILVLKTKLYTVFLKVAPFYRPNSIIGHTIMNI